jgi:succinate dehydrogenase / fumarate reductase flavoprotein subunit
MEKYDPDKMELSTRDVVARANFREIMHGNGTPNGGVWLDISERSKEYLQQRLPKMLSMIQEYNNVDISEAPVEVAPTAHYTMGGIRFDHETFETTIENFFVAGECTMGVHGGNRL